MRNLITILMSCCVSLSMPVPADAGVDSDIQPLAAIQSVVHDFILAGQMVPEALTADVRPLDNRLRLRRCEDELQAQWSPGSRSLGRVTVQVACSAPVPWRVHVQADVSMEGTVWALQRSVQRGDKLSADLLMKKKVVLGSNNLNLLSTGVPIIDESSWLGYAFVQRVTAGSVLTEKMLKRANLVNKGEKVLIRYHTTGVQLQTTGIALSSAMASQRLQVKNVSSGKIVEAFATGPGLVDVLH